MTFWTRCFRGFASASNNSPVFHVKHIGNCDVRLRWTVVSHTDKRFHEWAAPACLR